MTEQKEPRAELFAGDREKGLLQLPEGLSLSDLVQVHTEKFGLYQPEHNPWLDSEAAQVARHRADALGVPYVFVQTLSREGTRGTYLSVFYDRRK